MLINSNLDVTAREVPGYVFYYNQSEVVIDNDTDPKVAKALRIAEFYSANVNEVFPDLYDHEDVGSY